MAVTDDEVEEAPNIEATGTNVTPATGTSVTIATSATGITATLATTTGDVVNISPKSENAGSTQPKPEAALSDLFPPSLETFGDDDSGLGGSNREVTRSSCPVPASDYYTGPTDSPQGPTLVSNTAAGARARRITSLEGSDGLDSLSGATVRNKFAQLSLTPRHDVPHHFISQHDVAFADEALSDRFDPKQDAADAALPDRFDPKNDVLGESLILNSLDPKYEMAEKVTTRDADAKVVDDIPSRLIELESEADNIALSEIPLQSDNEIGKLNNMDSGVNLFKPNFEDDFPDNDIGKPNKERSVPTPERGPQAPVDYRQLSVAEIHRLQVLAGKEGDPWYPQYVLRSDRLATFPIPTVLCGIQVDREQLANTGFFFRHVNEVQSVTCYQCGGSLHDWKEGMNAGDEHVMLAPRCPASRL